jgi:hypothetical protein
LSPRDAWALRRYVAVARRRVLTQARDGAVDAAALADRLAGPLAALDRLPATTLRRPLGDVAALIERLPDGAAHLLALAAIARARPTAIAP